MFLWGPPEATEINPHTERVSNSLSLSKSRSSRFKAILAWKGSSSDSAILLGNIKQKMSFQLPRGACCIHFLVWTHILWFSCFHLIWQIVVFCIERENCVTLVLMKHSQTECNFDNRIALHGNSTQAYSTALWASEWLWQKRTSSPELIYTCTHQVPKQSTRLS